MIMGICLSEGEMRHVMVVAFFAFFSQIGAMVVPEQIGLERCACAQIDAHEERNRWLYFDDAGDSSEGEARQT